MVEESLSKWEIKLELTKWHKIYLVNKSASCRGRVPESDVLRPIIINGNGNAKYNIWSVLSLLSDQTAGGDQWRAQPN